jgi:hypothetical protein
LIGETSAEKAMSSSNALLPIVVGVGLTVLSGGALAERRGDRDRPRWDATLFFFLAVQLIGFCVVGGHTLMHLSYEVDMDALESGNRKILLEAIEQRTAIEERSGASWYSRREPMSSPATSFSSFRRCSRSATYASSRASASDRRLQTT